MTTLHIDDMTCGHCVGVVTRALQGVDPDARIDVRLAERRVQVESARADAAALLAAVVGAGYNTTLAPAASGAPERAA